MSYLRRLPVDVLKIDRSFVSDLERSEQSRQIVGTIMDLARSLGMQVVAEGAELEEQVSYLAALDCDFGQGYVFARPLDEQAARTALSAASNRAAGDQELANALGCPPHDWPSTPQSEPTAMKLMEVESARAV